MKNELERSFVNGDAYRTEDLAKRADNVKNYEEVDPVVKEYETINRWQKKSILNARLNQGCIFKKFKVQQICEMFKELGARKSAIYFRIYS